MKRKYAPEATLQVKSTKHYSVHRTRPEKHPGHPGVVFVGRRL